jgi:hypothetical protein
MRQNVMSKVLISNFLSYFTVFIDTTKPKRRRRAQEHLKTLKKFAVTLNFFNLVNLVSEIDEESFSI